jgi:LytR cell envelope-related transcriptional attenuator
LQEIVQALGAAAGFANLVGLAVLSALYVSHAREMKRLREWAGRAPERSALGAAAVPGPTSSPEGPIAARAVPEQSVTAPRRRSVGTRSVAAAGVGLLVLGGAAAYGVTRLTGDDGAGNTANAQANNHNGVAGKPRRRSAAVKPGNVTVAVLNGTTVPGLAAALRDRLGAAGWKEGMIDDFSDQQLAESVVQYAPGHQAEAKAVGRTIGITRREPVTADSRVLAGDAAVIVIAGADKAP